MCGLPSNMNSSLHETWQTILFLNPLQSQNLKRKKWGDMAYYAPPAWKSGGTRPLCPPPNYARDYNSELIAIMTPQPPERISFVLLKSFAPASLLFIRWGSYVRFYEDILWCFCWCNHLRLWGGAGQLVCIPVFSLVQIHHERIAHMRHLSPFGRGEDHLWTSRLIDRKRQVPFSGVDAPLRRGCLFCHSHLLCSGTCSKSLAERVQGGFDGCYVQVDRYNCLPTSSGWAWVRSPVGWIKHQKSRPNCQLVQTRAHSGMEEVPD